MKTSKKVLGVRALQGRGDGEVSESPGLRGRTEVSVREAKDTLSALLQRAQAGDEVVITSDGEPIAMLVRYRPKPAGRPWTSLAAFRATLPMTPDSTEIISAAREERLG